MTDLEDRILRLVRNEPGISGGAIAVRIGGTIFDQVANFEILYGLKERGLLRYEWHLIEGAYTRRWYPGPVCR